MRCASVLSSLEEKDAAVSEAVEKVCAALDGEPVTWVAAFVSGHDEELLYDLSRRLRARYPDATSIGATAEGAIAQRREVERRPALGILAVSSPGARAVPFHVSLDELEAGVAVGSRLPAPSEIAGILVVSDPFSADPRRFLGEVAESHPGVPVIGGLASGGDAPGTNRLLVDGRIESDGVVGLALAGDVEVVPVVSQGCRPVGERYVVTRGGANVMHTLRGSPALDVLKEMALQLPAEDRHLLHDGLFVGQAVDEYCRSFGRGDFLIRGILGADSATGSIAIGGDVRTGTTIQFHVRDAASADEDLRLLLQKAGGRSFDGGLLFTCNGRGTRMWDQPGHDAGVIDEILPGLPVAGMFCAGEIGPLRQANHLHGFTASIALMRGKRS